MWQGGVVQREVVNLRLPSPGGGSELLGARELMGLPEEGDVILWEGSWFRIESLRSHLAELPHRPWLDWVHVAIVEPTGGV